MGKEGTKPEDDRFDGSRHARRTATGLRYLRNALMVSGDISILK